MKQIKCSYITRMPDKSGAFLKASKIIAEANGNIVRVSYNKAVDLNTLFLEVKATKLNQEKIAIQLEKIGYLAEPQGKGVVLIVLTLQDKPGELEKVLTVIKNQAVNISYLSSQENGTDYQHFKMGLFAENASEIKNLLDELSLICPVKVLDYEVTEKILDGTVFYITFANEMRELLSLDQKKTNSVMINANRIMQLLDERNELPFKTFEYIVKFAQYITLHKDKNFIPRVSIKPLGNIVLYSIEPPCGCTMYIIKTEEGLIFFDSGFACYKNEYLTYLKTLFDDFDELKKVCFLTHADIDHSGFLEIFDEVRLSFSAYENFQLESEGKPNYREQNNLHAPYCKLSKIITDYKTPSRKNMKPFNQSSVIGLEKTDEIEIFGLNFEVLEGEGGHVKGETCYVENNYKICITGDLLVNIKGFTAQQAQFNLLAPYLMTSVNVNSTLALKLREKLFLYKGYLVCAGHGSPFIA